MLHLVDESLESLLRADVLPRGVDVSFDVPDDSWRAGVTRPTVDLFLYDVRRNGERQHSGWALAEEDGRRVRRPPVHHVDCRYLVTVWAAETADQHQLLGTILAALLDLGPLPDDHLAGPLADVRPPPDVSAAWPTEREPFEFWTALGGQLRPGIDLTVTLPVDRRLAAAAGPPVERVTDTVSMAGGPGESSERVGGRSPRSPEDTLVWTRRGSDRVAGAGFFLVPGRAGDHVWVAEPPHEDVVPEDGSIAVDEG